MTEMVRVGSSPMLSPKAAAGINLPSARFEVYLGTQIIGSGSGDTIIQWDSSPVDDDIGLVLTGSRAYFNFGDGQDGKYLVTAYAQADPEPNSFVDGGTMELQIDWSGSANPDYRLDPHQSTPLNDDTRPKMAVSDVQRIYAGGQLSVFIRTNLVVVNSVVWFASVTITKLSSIPPL